jgi:4-hydroxythreonine-4-phosphate dehydrogenase
MTRGAAAGPGGDKPIALTMGEPAGIGGEITLKAWLRRTGAAIPFVAIDDADRLRRLAASLGLNVPVQVVDAIEEVPAVFARALPVLDRPLAEPAIPGRLNPANAPAVIGAIETAVGLAKAGTVGAVVTNPIHKKALYEAGFAFPGHTEFLAALCEDATPVMMLAGPTLRVVPVTTHVSLRAAIATLNTELIIRTATITDAALRSDFGIERPRLAIAGLNPHAGEQGELGSEEAELIEPAVDALRGQGIDAFGPLPPDTLFSPRSRRTFDAAICMYHDQALIPLKALDFDNGVNVTLGLPFVRTSPDHGTALDIAGTGRADESSLMASLELAAALARRRAGSAPG